MTAPVAVPQRPDASGRGPEPVVHDDEAALVGLDPGGVQAEVAGVGRATDGDQDVAGIDQAIALDAIDGQPHPVAVLCRVDAFGSRPDGDAFRLAG